MNLVPESLNELQNFDRGQDPKTSLRIGVNHIIPEITRDDLEIIDDILGDKGLKSYEEWYEEHGEDYDDDEEAREIYDRLVKIELAIGDKIKGGEFFDHHEFDTDEFKEYFENPPEGYDWAYNAYPDGDGIYVIWSSVHLPAAEEIEI